MDYKLVLDIFISILCIAICCVGCYCLGYLKAMVNMIKEVREVFKEAIEDRLDEH